MKKIIKSSIEANRSYRRTPSREAIKHRESRNPTITPTDNFVFGAEDILSLLTGIDELQPYDISISEPEPKWGILELVIGDSQYELTP